MLVMLLTLWLRSTVTVQAAAAAAAGGRARATVPAVRVVGSESALRRPRTPPPARRARA
jgi:hypothetical protein